MSSMLHQIAVSWTQRQAALQLKGKKADSAVFEYFAGAAKALELASHPEAGHVAAVLVTTLAFVPFPCGTVAGWAMMDPVKNPHPG